MRGLLLLVLLGTVLRLLALWFTWDTPPIRDERDYHTRALAELGERFVLAEGKRAPASSWLYARGMELWGTAATVPRTMNVALSSLTVLWIGLLGRRLAGDRVGLAAAAAQSDVDELAREVRRTEAMKLAFAVQ